MPDDDFETPDEFDASESGAEAFDPDSFASDYDAAGYEVEDDLEEEQAAETAFHAAEATESLRGKFLVAGPQLRDRNFFKGVVLILEHTAIGAMGLVVNRPSSLSLANALAGEIELPCSDELVFIGGPVEPDHLFLIHHNHGWSHASVEVSPGVHVTTDPEAFEAVVTSQEHEPRRILSGYAGWAPGQLEGELASGDWQVVDASVADVFGPDPYMLWDDLRSRISQSNRLIRVETPHPEWN